MTARALSILGALAIAAISAACSSSSGGSGGNGSSGSVDSGALDASSKGIESTCNGDDGPPPPRNPAALQTWLAMGIYKCWAHESSQHPSDGPHGGEVRVYLNTRLDTSLKGTGEHPEGAVAVKELFGTSGTAVTGWAVLIKTQPSSAAGQGFYWYEVFGTQAGANNLEGQGKALCVDCHGAGGKDFVLIRHPLR